MANQYTPNFNDRRVQVRAKRALGFVLGVMSSTKPHEWSTRYIDQFLGQQQHPLGGYLRDLLLTTTSERWNKDTGQCKSYCLNESGVKYLSEALGLPLRDDDKLTHTHNTLLYNKSDIVSDWCATEYQQELENKDFNYTLKSDRYWHPLQNIRSHIRRDVLGHSGLAYQYDIECCAPTLIMYHAHHLGMSEYLFALQSYLTRKDQIRAMLSRDLEISPEVTKRIINALFCGARISSNHDSSIYQYLDYDYSRLLCLKQHHYIIQLRKDIKCCWDYIEEAYEKRYSIDKHGRLRRVRMNSKRKWGVYFSLERGVVEVVSKYLKEENIKFFLEHDGWTTDRLIDLELLTRRIKLELDYTLMIKLTHTHNTLLYNIS